MEQRTNKSIAKELISFSLPLILSGILQQLYSWADAFILGHAEGELQLAAVGATGSISMLLINTMTGFALGLSILAAQEVGRGNGARVKKLLANFLPLLGAVYSLLAAVLFFMASPVLAIMDTPAEIFGYSLIYIKIISLGKPFLAVYNLYAALLRAVGNTKAAFFAVLISSAMNVALDILFVVVLPYGVAGAAAATVISQIAMTVYIVWFASHRYPELCLEKGSLRFDRGTFKEGLSFALPPTIQNSVTSFGNLILQNFMNGFGASTVLAITTAYRVDSIMLLPVINLGAAVSSMTARSKGAGDGERIRSYLKNGLVMIIAVALLLSAAMFLLGAQFVAIFGVTGEALQAGRQFFRDLSVFYTLFGIGFVLKSVLEGIGDITFCSAMGIITLGVRIAASYALRPVFLGRTIAIAEGVSWVFMMVLYGVRVWLKRYELRS